MDNIGGVFTGMDNIIGWVFTGMVKSYRWSSQECINNMGKCMFV